MGKKTKMLQAAILFLVCIAVPSLLAQQTIDNWKIVPGTDGRAATMQFANPQSTMRIEAQLEIVVDATAMPSSGTLTFKSGFSRPMTPGEVAFYWTEYKGDNAYWNWRGTQSSTTKFSSMTDPIPTGFIGGQARVLSVDELRYIGILSALTNNIDWFALTIKGSRILFYRKAAKEIEQLK